VTLYFETFGAAAIGEGDRVLGVVIENAAGRQVILAKVTVDATGHGDIAAAAGAAFDKGRGTDGFMHEIEHGPLRDATNVEDLSRAFLRWPASAPSLNVRESRRIQGDYTLTFDDAIRQRRFADVICRWRSNYDSHFPHSANQDDQAQDWIAMLGLFRKPIEGDIPYRCILPRGLENLLVVAKSYSADHDALIGARMQRDLQHLGEAGGVAAAMACREAKSPRQLSVASLQRELIALGVLPRDDAVKSTKGEPGLAPFDPQTLLAQLGGDGALDAMVRFYLEGPPAAPLLLPLLDSPEPKKREEAALVLGMLARRESIPALLDFLRAKNARRFTFAIPDGSTRPSVPLYYSAVILLGRFRERRAAPPVIDLLRDPERCPADLASFAIVALGRIGDRGAIPVIRPYLDWGRDARIDNENRQFEDHWGVRTNAAKALGQLGDLSGVPMLAELLGADQSLLRDYAQRLLEQITGQRFGKDRAGWLAWYRRQ